MYLLKNEIVKQFFFSNNEMYISLYLFPSLSFFLRVVSYKYVTLHSTSCTGQCTQEQVYKPFFFSLYRFGKFISSVPNTLRYFYYDYLK